MTDHDKAIRAYADFLKALGIDAYPGTNIDESARLVTDLMAYWTSGGSLKRPILSPMKAPDQGRISLTDIPFYSFCAHHFVPFFGTVRIDYDPDQTIAGLGGFMRIIDYYARRPQLQENLTIQIADHIFSDLSPKGLRVRLQTRQMCVELKGHGSGIQIETEARRGIFND